MPRRPLSLAARQTIVVAMIVVAALCVVAGLAVQLTRAHLRRDLDRDLHAVVDSFRDGPAREPDAATDLPEVARGWLAGLSMPSDRLVVIRAAGGEVLSSPSEIDLREWPQGAELLTATESRWVTLDDGRIRALAVPLSFDGDGAGTMVVAASTKPIDQTTSALLRQVLVAAAVGLALAVSLTTIAVRRSLRPLGHMASEVEAIHAAEDLSRRVVHEGPHDEVGRLATAFNRSLAQLEQAFATHRQFIADASHELRTPLTVVRGEIELLKSSVADEHGARALRLVLDELDRMTRVVEELLLLARLDEGLPLRREPVEVELVVEEALLRTAHPMGLAVDVRAQSGLMATADEERLMQVLVNLVTNAASHAGDDVHITITTTSVDRWAVIEVVDDGPGIPASNLGRVFDRFYRGTPARSTQPGSAGLGLAIVRSLTERMGGSVAVRSEPGHGATFTIHLPRWSDGAGHVPSESKDRR